MTRFFFYAVFLISFSSVSQNYGKLKLITKLPAVMDEVSGIEKFPNHPSLFMINDARNPPEVYALDTKTLKKGHTIRVKGATNIDWEDLASSPDGRLFIGDFGNNISNRTDLTIYTVTEPWLINKRRTKTIETTFSFSNQTKFPPKNEEVSFDVEGFIFLKDYFYLFTRNRAKHFNGITNIYKLPAKEGKQTAKLIGTFYTGNNPKDCQITGAAIHHRTGKIALLSYNKVWIFNNYTEDNFTTGSVETIELGHFSQKESICFLTENDIYIADEKSKGEGKNLYLLKLK